MIKVIIIDDEFLIRSLIKKSVKWETMGFEIVGEAEDGKEALEKVEELSPHLLVIDIDIPIINGIELSSIVKEKYPYIKMLILTGYGEFEYAKKAISSGVYAYILKPVDNREFEEVLLKVKRDIINEKKRRQYVQVLEEELKNDFQAGRERFLNSLVTANADCRNLYRDIKRYDLSICEECAVVAAIEIDGLIKKWPGKKDQDIWIFAVGNIAGEIFGEYEKSIVFKGPENRVICILSSIDNFGDSFLEICSSLCIKVKESIKKYLSFTVSIGYGSCVKGCGNIPLSYSEAVQSVERKFLVGKDSLIGFSEADGIEPNQSVILVDDAEDVLISLRIGDRNAVERRINKLFREINNAGLSKDNILIALMEFVSILAKFADERNIDYSEVFNTQKHFSDVIRTFEVLSELKEWTLQIFNNIFKYIGKNRGLKTLEVVEKARKFIEDNYFVKELSLKDISENIFVNPSYLSKVFKQQTGYSVIEYLRDFRLKRAMEIIENRKIKHVSALADEVGYSDPLYFGKLFKGKYGISPQKYLKNL